MAKHKVLFVCIHNSARSQMAEALLKKIGGPQFDVESAGFEPGTLNPLAVEALKEEGIDIAGKKTKSVFDFFKEGRIFNTVITVCDESQAERCPVFPGMVNRLHWSFADPSSFQGTWEEKLEGTRKVREQVRAAVTDWVAKLRSEGQLNNL